MTDLTFDWMEPARVVKVEVLQDKARQLGVTSEDIAGALNGIVGGVNITQVRDSIYLVDVLARARPSERQSVDTLLNLQLPGRSGQSVPLAAIATFSYEIEQPVVWRRSRIPTITLRAGILDDTQPATIVEQLAPEVAAFTATLPVGYTVSVAGPVEESAKAQGPIAAVVPLMLFMIATILMLQLRSFQRLFLVVAVAPLGLIGVVAALLPSRAPLGFVAILGVLALIGILIRNSVILIMQVEALARWRHPGLGRGLRRDASPHAPDPADRRRRQPRVDPDRPRGLLGADGLRDDGRDHRRHRPDPALPSGALRRLVPGQGPC